MCIAMIHTDSTRDTEAMLLYIILFVNHCNIVCGIIYIECATIN